MSTPKILVADNLDLIAESLRAYLENEGFQVRHASTPEEALRILNEKWVHAAIVDLRLRDDEDAKDFSGLTEVLEAADPAVPKIISSAYPTWQLLSDALGPRPGGHLPPAAAFVYKGDDLSVLLDTLRDVLVKARLNFELEMHSEGDFSFLALAATVEGSRRIEDVSVMQAAGDELHDVYRKLFADRKAISIRWLPYGRSPMALTLVQPEGELGTQGAVVVQCGPRATVRSVKDSWQTFVEPYAAAHVAHLEAYAETLHYAGIAYRVDGPAENFTRFSDFYRVTSDPEAVITVFETLFTKTCGPWYRQAMLSAVSKSLDVLFREYLDLEGEYEDVAREISSMMRRPLVGATIEQESERKTLSVHFIEGLTITLPDPTPLVFDRPDLFTFSSPPVLGITHGNLTVDNILVNPEGHVWLVDFSKTGIGFILRDFIQVEAAITLELNQTSDLYQLYRVHIALLTPKTLIEDIPLLADLPNDLRKALLVVNRLRRLAAQVGVGDIRQYYSGLLFHAVQCILVRAGGDGSQFADDAYRKTHALLAAALTAKRLLEWPAWEGVRPSPRVELLTDREREILGSVAKGLSNRDIGEQLGIAETTVKKHLSNIFPKLGTTRRREAAAIARRAGLL